MCGVFLADSTKHARACLANYSEESLLSPRTHNTRINLTMHVERVKQMNTLLGYMTIGIVSVMLLVRSLYLWHTQRHTHLRIAKPISRHTYSMHERI